MQAGHVFHHTFPAMGTRFSLVLPDLDRAAGESLAQRAEDEVRAQEKLMSRFDVHSPLSEINRAASLAAVKPPGALWSVLTLCRNHWQRTNGAFDIAQTLTRTRQRAGFQNVRMDDHARTLSFAAPVQLDLGAIGKGIALESVVREFRDHGVTHAFLSFGESSIAVIGSHPTGAPWPVGITDLFHADRVLHTFHLRDASVSTSGNAPAGGQADHIVDPRTGRPIAGYRTMSVACASPVDAEALSTALFATPAKERAGILANYPGVSAVEIAYKPQDGSWSGRIAWQHES